MNNDDTVTEENEAVRNRTIVSDLIDLQLQGQQNSKDNKCDKGLTQSANSDNTVVEEDLDLKIVS